jgi:mRNA interferase RelE/StbE
MKTAFRKSFLRDLKKIKSRDILDAIQEVIVQVEAAADLQQIANLKKMSGSTGFYRIRIGDYRIGVAVEGDTVEFVRCLNRRDLYKYFP